LLYTGTARLALFLRIAGSTGRSGRVRHAGVAADLEMVSALSPHPLREAAELYPSKPPISIDRADDANHMHGRSPPVG
jgi:hypothetical protein